MSAEQVQGGRGRTALKVLACFAAAEVSFNLHRSDRRQASRDGVPVIQLIVKLRFDDPRELWSDEAELAPSATGAIGGASRIPREKWRRHGG